MKKYLVLAGYLLIVLFSGCVSQQESGLCIRFLERICAYHQ